MPKDGDNILMAPFPPQEWPDGANDDDSGAATAVTLITFIANLMLSASLNQLWSMINTQ